MVVKCAAIVPLAGRFRFAPRDRWPIALLMSTRLTFVTVAAYVGLSHHIINWQQYAILLTADIASGTIPALVAAQRGRLSFTLAHRSPNVVIA